MIKVLGLALYGSLAASTRYRLEQFVDGLAGHGIQLDVRHLLGDDYLRTRFAGGKIRPGGLAAGGWGRLRDLRAQSHYDAVMLYCELFPLMPAALERALLRKPYVYDFDDAFYLKYRRGRLAFAGSVLGQKIDRLLAGAAAVTAGNETLAGYARRHNADTRLVPTVVDTLRYQCRPEARGAGTFTIGWIGSPSTAAYLQDIAPALQQLAREQPVRFVVVGGKAPDVPGVEVHEMPWSEDTEVDLINTFDVGVMPLPDDDWARGKCAFKLIQYMACGVPVVASPVGANRQVVTQEVGFLATDTPAWVAALRDLRDDRQLRERMGAAARQRADEHYSLRAALPLLAAALRQAVGKIR